MTQTTLIMYVFERIKIFYHTVFRIPTYQDLKTIFLGIYAMLNCILVGSVSGPGALEPPYFAGAVFSLKNGSGSGLDK